MIASLDPQLDLATRMIGSCIVNLLVGAAVGLAGMLVGGSSQWTLPFAAAATVLISPHLVRIQTMWRPAPITAARVIASGLTHQSQATAIEFALLKVAEVVFGCVAGLLIGVPRAAIGKQHVARWATMNTVSGRLPSARTHFLLTRRSKSRLRRAEAPCCRPVALTSRDRLPGTKRLIARSAGSSGSAKIRV